MEGASCGEFKSNHHNPALKEFTVAKGDEPQVDSFRALSLEILSAFLWQLEVSGPAACNMVQSPPKLGANTSRECDEA